MFFLHSKIKIPTNIRLLLLLLMVFGMVFLLMPYNILAIETQAIDVSETNYVFVDIKPGSCPNPLNIKSRGVLPVAILGTAGFDVEQIDIATIRLLGVAPIRSRLEDVATPFSEEITTCQDCTGLGPDGYMDLTLKFRTQEIVAALGTVTDSQCVVLELTGNLKEEFGGTSIVGEDVVLILKKGKK